MRSDIVLTLTGPDRVGIVEEVTRALLELDGNVGTSRMARLGGEFAILMLVSLPSERLDALDAALERFTTQGYAVTATETHAEAGESGRVPYRIEVTGADHEGIVHEVARGLSQRGITIESMDTGTTQGAVSGTPLFSMSALVGVPAEVAETDWIETLLAAGDEANVDITVESADAS